MKISQKQANLLAKEIVRQLTAKKVQKAPEHIVKAVTTFSTKRNVLIEKKNKVEDEIRTHDKELYKIIGKNYNVSCYDSAAKIIEKFEQKNVPNTQEIEDEIILKSMFANEDDMKSFVDSIVSKYEKKLQSKILVS